jgi:hypothetical protein
MRWSSIFDDRERLRGPPVRRGEGRDRGWGVLGQGGRTDAGDWGRSAHEA